MSFNRPDWEKCADHVNGGILRWKELSEGKRSNELVDVLLTEMAAGGIADMGGAEFFDGQVCMIDGLKQLIWTELIYIYRYITSHYNPPSKNLPLGLLLHCIEVPKLLFLHFSLQDPLTLL